MKFSLLPVVLFAFFNSYSQTAAKENAFTVKGNIKGYPDEKIYVTYGPFGSTKLDSVAVTNGAFSISGKISEPYPAMVFSRNYRVRYDFYVDKGVVTITGSADSSNYFNVEGSPTVNLFQEFNQGVMRNREKVMKAFQEEYDLRKAGDSIAANSKKRLADSLYRHEYVLRVNFIREHPGSHPSASELLAVSKAENLEETKKMFAAFSKEVKHSKKGKEIAERIAILSRTATGQNAVNFAQDNTKGEKISLDSFKGQYVLLEFWASWCGPCRAENPNLLKQYAIFHPKGFDVLGVSLDNSKENWIKAIEKDGLVWQQISDLKGWRNEAAALYGIKAIPANFLIDPSGKIIAQNLRGEELNKKLEEIFN